MRLNEFETSVTGDVSRGDKRALDRLIEALAAACSSKILEPHIIDVGVRLRLDSPDAPRAERNRRDASYTILTVRGPNTIAKSRHSGSPCYHASYRNLDPKSETRCAEALSSLDRERHGSPGSPGSDPTDVKQQAFKMGNLRVETGRRFAPDSPLLDALYRDAREIDARLYAVAGALRRDDGSASFRWQGTWHYGQARERQTRIWLEATLLVRRGAITVQHAASEYLPMAAFVPASGDRQTTQRIPARPKGDDRLDPATTRGSDRHDSRTPPGPVGNGKTEGFAEENANTFFCVSYSVSLGAEEHERFFETKEGATAFAERMLPKYSCIWMGTYAEYENQAGNWREHWVWFWWSPEAAVEWGECPDSGESVPDGRQYVTRYRPIRSLARRTL